MLGRVVVCAEQAGCLERDVDVEVVPRKIGGIALGEQLNLVVADREHVTVAGNVIESAVDGIVLGEILHVVVGHHVVDRDDLDVVVLE